ncbi:unnamed protein product [Knipowitschia caucasica]
MSHRWNPYLQKYSPQDHGTPASEMNHHSTGGCMSHDGFSNASVPHGASGTNTNYSFNNCVGNANDSRWCPEMGNCQRNSREWQPDGEQSNYVTRWENEMPNYEQRVSATAGHHSIPSQPQLGLQQEPVVPTGSQFLSNYNIQGSSGEGLKSSFGYMTSTSVHNPQSIDSESYHSEWLQKQPEDTNCDTEYTYPNNTWRDQKAENSTNMVQDRSKIFTCDGISIANSKACTGSETQGVASFGQSCKQEKFVNICHESFVSETCKDHERQAMVNIKETNETITCPDSALPTFNHNRSITTQAYNPTTESPRNIASSLDLPDSCQNEMGFSKDVFSSNKNTDRVNSDFQLINNCEKHSQASTAEQSDEEMETVYPQSSLALCNAPTGDVGSSESYMQPEMDHCVHSSTETWNVQQAVQSDSFSHSVNVGEMSTQCDAPPEQTLNDANINVGVTDTSHDKGYTEKNNVVNVLGSLPSEMACPAENNGESDDTAGVVEKDVINKKTIKPDSEQASVMDSLNITPENETSEDVPNDRQSQNEQFDTTVERSSHFVSTLGETSKPAESVTKKTKNDEEINRAVTDTSHNYEMVLAISDTTADGDDDKPIISDLEQTSVLDSLNITEEIKMCGESDDKQSINEQVNVANEKEKIDNQVDFSTEKTNNSEKFDLCLDDDVYNPQCLAENNCHSDGDNKKPNISDPEKTCLVDSLKIIKEQEQEIDEQNRCDQIDTTGEKELQFCQSPKKSITDKIFELNSHTESHLSNDLECPNDSERSPKPSNSDESIYVDGEPLSPSSLDEEELAEQDYDPMESSFIEKHPGMKPSTAMWKRLHPIVLLKTSEVVDITGNKYACAQCSHIASNLDDLIEHHSLHDSMHSFQLCNSCGTYFVCSDQLSQHVCRQNSQILCPNSRWGEKGRGYHCNKCGLKLKQWYNFVKHMRSHTGKTPYNCENCGIYFSQSASLRRHQKNSKHCARPQPDHKSHTYKFHRSPVKSMFSCFVKLSDITKTNVCQYCGKCFSSKFKATKHYYNVHKKPGTNKQRPKPSRTAAELCSDEYKYKCPLCPQNFYNQLNRNQHVKKCVRDKTFGGKCRVNKRFQCPLCRATFSLTSNRYRHIQTFCLKHFMSYLRSGKTKMQKKWHRYSKDMATVLDKLKADEEQLNGKLESNVNDVQCEPKYRCNLCPAVFFHSSGRYRHMKKHKLYERTGQNVTYKNSIKRYIKRTRGMTNTEEKSQKDHVNQGERPYKCTQCGKGFKSNIILLQHKVTHQRKVQCTVCKKILPTIGDLIEHRKSHINKGLLQCPDCPMTFTFPVFLLRHVKTHLKNQNKLLQEEEKKSVPVDPQPHCEGKHSCPLCNQVFDQAQLLSRHYLTHDVRHGADCPFCRRNFTTRRNLARHMARHMTGKRFLCKCGTRFFQVEKLKLHRETCSLVGPSCRCRYCSRPFLYQVHLDKHHIAHQKKTLTKCPTCKFYYGFSKIFQHKRICTGAEITDSSAQSQKPDQQTILNVSSKENPYKCPHCPETYKYPSLYNRHVARRHKDVETHACILCGQNFPSRLLCSQHEASCEGLLGRDKSMKRTEMHSQRHTSEFKCKFCNKSFAKSRNLRCHILTHNEAKPYRCKVCDSCFSRYDHLKVHMGRCKGKLHMRPQICIPKISLALVGTGWKKALLRTNVERGQAFECRICGRRYTTKTKLNWHNSMMHTKKQFKCTRCCSYFSNEKTHQNHLRFRKCILTSPMTKRSDGPETEDTNISSEKCNKILARIQPIPEKHNFSKMIKCNFCPRTFRSNALLKVHMNLHSGEKPFGCGCGKAFFRRDHLKRHTKICKRKPTESPSSGFSCAYCSSRFLLFSQLQQHFLNAHKLETIEPVTTTPLQQHLSNIQRNESSQASKLNMAIYEKRTSPFVCGICSKGFWNKLLLRNHFRKCKRLDSSTNDFMEEEVPLRANIEMVLADPPAELSTEEEMPETETKSSAEKKTSVYQCSECDQSFTDGLMLISHLEDHGREEQEKRQNKCPKCGKMFSSQAKCENHMKLHESRTGVCSVCSAEFNSNTELDLHRKQYHDTSNSYSCRLCKYRFRSRVSLCEHYIKEHPDEIFTCTLCGKNFTLKGSLVRHMNQRHNQNDIGNFGNQIDGAEKAPSTRSGVDKVPSARSGVDKVPSARSGVDKVPSAQSEADKVPSAQSGADKVPSSRSTSESGDDYADDYVYDDSDSADSDSAPYFPCHVCGKTFTTSENLEDHQRCHTGEKPFECAQCGQCFFQSGQLQQHERKHNSEYQCRICGRGFVSLFALRKHKHTSGKKRPFQCSKCQLYFKSASQLAEHTLSHQEESFPCDICNRVFPSKSSRVEHRKIHLPKQSHTSRQWMQAPVVEVKEPATVTPSSSNEFKYRCGLCCLRFKNPEDLSEHGCLPGSERQYSCMDCDKHFLHSSHLKKHLSTHKQSSLNKYPCNQCNNIYSTPQDFLNHLSKHDQVIRYGRQGYVCPVCHESFVSPSKLAFHFPTHPSETFECRSCKSTFLTASKLIQHTCAQKERKCPRCGKRLGLNHVCSQKPQDASFGDEDEIDVTGEDMCHCPFCPRQFSSKSNLLEHQNKYHPNEKTYKCEMCARTYAKQKYLDNHIKEYHQKQPEQSTSQIKFRCGSCHREFSSAKDLSLHLKLHAAEKDVGDFRCDMCYKSFSHLSSLRQHQESHVGQVVYECTECDKAFAFPHLLEVHQKSHG